MFIRFTSPILIEVSGRHAARYLQNRLSNDIGLLAPGAGACTAAALSVQGRLQGLFTVLRLQSEQFLLICEGGDSEQIKKHLAQFKVAEQVDFTNVSSQFAVLRWEASSTAEVAQIFPELQSIPSSGSFSIVQGGFITNTRGFTPRALLCIIPQPNAVQIIAQLSTLTRELSADALRVARVRRNLPSFPTELREDLLFSEANLPEAVSFTKGCYVGQEVVAKIDAIGKAPRQLLPFAVRGRHPELAEAPVTKTDDSTPRALGEVVSAVYDPVTDETVGFLILRNDPALLEIALSANGIPITVLHSERRS